MIFESTTIGKMQLRNRFVRSATYEGQNIRLPFSRLSTR
jgi:2,4-dienoyl-CoA reductase-like NADH-dependent reductase (Old Yellow Enzyme family)